ncbi:MAG: N,N-dimethylformamidase [Rhodospirillales bacterium]|jgi:N,N-dimethylformamidase|nr:N,N-dimethylformamidase [Rhodospirillales bacterium]MBT4041490.1 N,N-dimethylformamidase [Rhodospirillales bacterium]MBT5350995.1 N,N-dimethylformamidase [Rhodospirillales bacterium]MBT6824976.1 N,N-dimethylformamidase [Rhodospirillales bacterium]MBT7505436.1 N,N-dimethylformamidase [Rhodospirillales bacterium]
MRKLFGYSDQISVRPGDTIRFMVSSLDDTPYRADIVRMICGDTNPKGPGFKETVIEASANGDYPGRMQPMHDGSYVTIPGNPLLDGISSFTLQAMIWPTTPRKGHQALLGKWCEKTKSGFSLCIDENGSTALCLGDGSGAVETLSAESPMIAREWYFVAASFDAETGKMHVYQEPLADSPGIGKATFAQSTSRIAASGPNGVPFIMAAQHKEPGSRAMDARYNGKIDSPRLANRVLSRAEMAMLVDGPMPEVLESDILGWWDFSRDIPTTRVQDLSANRLHGETVNLPTRAMRGFNWNGSEQSWCHAPDQYGAIHFHDDDLYDAGWQTDFELVVPDHMKSGVYCARLIGADDEERIPFFVRPPAGTQTSDVALLISTATFMAYANARTDINMPFAEVKEGGITVLSAEDVFLQENAGYGFSVYDKHSDGTGVCYSSRLRPIFNMRPKTGLWSFNADTHVTDWLESMGQSFDVVTDEDLHQEGVAAMAPYRVVITGAHPEYWSTPMWDAMVAYQHRGGRLMYLGGNGFYWRIAYHDQLPGVIEMRRAEGGMRYQSAEPGEYYQSFNGELGGLWRRLGAPPNTLVGSGTVATGFDSASYYRRTEESHDPRAKFIFDGVGDDELIGDFGSLLGGAAGVELDGANRKLGTPPHALIVARSEGHSQLYFLCPEETPYHHPVMSGAENPRVRADLLFYETANGGGVFTTGSISWCASLGHNGYDNNVARITSNVLKRFLAPEPL